MTKFYLLILTISISFFSCKTASKAYEQGDYKEAIEKSVKKLQKDPNDYETRELIKKAYAHAVNKHEDEIRILSNSTNDNRYEQIYRQYNILQDLYTSIRQYPSISQIVKPTDYSSYVQTYKDKAADVYFEKGLAIMEGGDKRSYREAYQHFRNALNYKPKDLEIEKKLNEAYDAAIVKVLIVPIDQYQSYYYSNNSYQMRNFQTELIRQLNYNTNSSFIKFYSTYDAQSQNVRPDEILEMRLGDIQMGRPYDENNTRDVSKEVVVKEIVHKPDSVTKQYATVRARITTTRRILVSDVNMYVTSRDANNRILWSDNFRGEHRWQVEFSTYTGDERALSDNDKALLNKTSNRNVPREDDVVDDLLRQLQHDLTFRLRDYYRRYN